MSHFKTIFIPLGYAATLTTDAFSAATYVQTTVGGTKYTPTSMAASATAAVGPFNDPRTYDIQSDGNEVDVALTQSGVNTAADDAVVALLAPKASPTFTGTVVVPTPFTIGAVSMTATGTQLNYVAGVTSAIQTQLNAKAPVASPTFTGTVVLPLVTVTKANGVEATNAVTASGSSGVITTSSLSAAAGATYIITWTNSAIAATSVIMLQWLGGTNTKDILFKVVPGSGSATLTIYNTDLLAALDGTVLIGYIVV